MHVHILGICGTFMAGLAVLARELGMRVSGSDSNVYPPMSTQLADAGIEIQQNLDFDPAQLRPAPDCVVVGNVMTRGNPAVEHLLNGAIPMLSGPQWLAKHVLAGRWPLAVAGTHGKTSTSAMLAWILDQAGLSPGFLIGGVPQNFGVSARLTGSERPDSPFFVIEADEYDSAFFDKRSKFIHYRPRTLVLNNLEFDHADIFPDLAAIQRQFHHLLRTVPGAGLIVSNGASPALDAVLAMGCWTPIERFIDQTAWRVELLEPDGSAFAVWLRDSLMGEVIWPQFGLHNVHNALAAIAAARHAGVPPAESCRALAGFGGVKRRLELRGSVGGINVYDDFAHHPSAIAATLAALRARIGEARLIAVLELRSNTMRSGVFNHALPEALRGAEQALIYFDPALGFDARAVFGDRADSYDSVDATLAALLDKATLRAGDHVVIMSNGAFGGLHQRLLTGLDRRTP